MKNFLQQHCWSRGVGVGGAVSRLAATLAPSLSSAEQSPHTDTPSRGFKKIHPSHSPTLTAVDFFKAALGVLAVSLCRARRAPSGGFCLRLARRFLRDAFTAEGEAAGRGSLRTRKILTIGKSSVTAISRNWDFEERACSWQDVLCFLRISRNF